LWDIRLGSFHIDHFIPQSVAPDLGCVYDNLVYVCARCNSVKSDLDVPDPCKISFAESMKVVESGTVEALDESGEILVEVLNLNERDRVRYRKLLIDTLSSLAPEKEEEILCQWLGFPDDLPNLSNRQAANSRPDGINQSYYEKRSRGELPPRY
jgi:5-methylcytosine-specific restriction endonuclease McrA